MNKAKYTFLIFAAVTATLASCAGEETQAEIERLSQENQKLQSELSYKDSTLSVFEESFSTIQRNLALISDREISIQMKSGELQMSEDAREEVTKDIQAINNLLEENKKTISSLNRKISGYGTEFSGFEKLIGQLEEDIKSKEEQIKFMKENLTAANFTIEILNEMLDSAEFRNEIQASMLELTVGELYTAHFAIGTYKELQRNDVLVKDGSIMGIAGSKKLKEDFNKAYFEEIDALETRSIPLHSKKAEVITNHPSNSYVIEGDNDKTLKVIDVDRFWSNSRFLVVVTD